MSGSVCSCEANHNIYCHYHNMSVVSVNIFLLMMKTTRIHMIRMNINTRGLKTGLKFTHVHSVANRMLISLLA